MTIIKSKDNPHIKLYLKLAGSKKERKNYGMYVLEGYRLVVDALMEDSKIASLFLTESAYEKYSSELSQADLREVNVLIISNELGIRISSTEKTQGVFAICRAAAEKEFEASAKSDGKYIVLYQLQDPGNVGMIIRTADAVGIDGIILSESCELYNPKVVRSTMGSLFRVNIFPDENIEKIITTMQEKRITTYAAVVDSDAQSLSQQIFGPGSAVLIGNEGNGLPDDISSKCDKRVTIKMKGNVNSLNAAMATGIFMWEMTKGNHRQKYGQ
ncbi:MAG: RNA methyltransferase [Oscillospiraceae bacterium]|nr:RNA methyltransferase [Oscillospiraceae bacterium]